MVDAAGQDLLVDRLVLTADVVTVQVDVEIIQAVALRERYVGIDVVHVEGVGGHLEIGGAKRLGPVGERVHEQVLAHLEVAHIGPGEDLADGKHTTVVDDVARVVLDVFVDVVGDDEVHFLVELDEAAQLGEERLERVGVGPVVGVDVLEVGAVGVGDGLHDGHAVAAVLLVDGLDKVRVAPLPLVGLGRGLILGAAVVDDDDLHVVGVIGALEDREDALVHVLGGVVARDAEGDGLIS